MDNACSDVALAETAKAGRLRRTGNDLGTKENTRLGS